MFIRRPQGPRSIASFVFQRMTDEMLAKVTGETFNSYFVVMMLKFLDTRAWKTLPLLMQSYVRRT